MTAETARRLVLTLGSEAAQAVELCLEDCRRVGDEVATRYWAEVAAQLRGLKDCNTPAEASCAEPLSPAARDWRLMQRVERYRHRAMQAERRVAGSEAHQAEMLDIALQWLELAQQTELLTEDVDAVANVYRVSRSRAASG
jgi:hypothetical protein